MNRALSNHNFGIDAQYQAGILASSVHGRLYGELEIIIYLRGIRTPPTKVVSTTKSLLGSPTSIDSKGPGLHS